LIALNIEIERPPQTLEIDGHGRALLSTAPSRGAGTIGSKLQLQVAEGVVLKL